MEWRCKRSRNGWLVGYITYDICILTNSNACMHDYIQYSMTWFVWNNQMRSLFSFQLNVMAAVAVVAPKTA